MFARMKERVAHRGAGALEVFPVSCGAGPGFVRREHLFGLVQRVGADDADNASGQSGSGFERNRSAKRVADEHDIAEVQRLGDGTYIAGKRRDGPGLPVPSGVSMAGEIERGHPERAGQRGQLRRPEGAVRQAAVDQQQRDRPRTRMRIHDLDAVRGERCGRPAGWSCAPPGEIAKSIRLFLTVPGAGYTFGRPVPVNALGRRFPWTSRGSSRSASPSASPPT